MHWLTGKSLMGRGPRPRVKENTVAAKGGLGTALLAAAALALGPGCAKVPYVCGRNHDGPKTLRLAPGEPQIERGKPLWLLDGLGHYVFSLPSKLLLWNWSVCNHDIPPEVEAKLERYLAENNLPNVKVRLNQYSPGGEWRRLVHNKDFNPFWRYALGVPAWLWYTLFPNRLWAGFPLLGIGDHYNPCTNTIHLYSGHKSIALHEAGHAKDFADESSKALYSLLYVLVPGGALYVEAQATGDAIGYDIAHGLTDDEKADYRILYPAYGTYVGGLAGYYLYLPMAIGGHVLGRIKAAEAVSRPQPQPLAAERPHERRTEWTHRASP